MISFNLSNVSFFLCKFVGIVVHHQLVECTGPVPIQAPDEDMVTDMMMTVMVIEMMIAMGTGERENGAIGMMTGMVEVGTVGMEIRMAGTLMNAMAKMVTEMMITGEIRAMMTTGMGREVGALIEKKIALMRMMIGIHPGMPHLFFPGSVAPNKVIHVDFFFSFFFLLNGIIHVDFDSS